MGRRNDSIDRRNHRDKGPTVNTNSSKNNFEFNWLMSFFSTPRRCHIVGGVIACSLIVASGWMSAKGREVFRDRKHSQYKIAESAQLISQASNLRSEHELELKLSKRYETELAEIKQWLPESVDWKTSKQTFKELAEKSGVQMLSVERKSSHLGSRVHVLSAKCEVNGTYTQVCKFIHSLTSLSKPVWCDSVQLKRNERVSEPGEAIRCDATLTLRMPFVGDDTTAEKLFHGEPVHAI